METPASPSSVFSRPPALATTPTPSCTSDEGPQTALHVAAKLMLPCTTTHRRLDDDALPPVVLSTPSTGDNRSAFGSPDMSAGESLTADGGLMCGCGPFAMMDASPLGMTPPVCAARVQVPAPVVAGKLYLGSYKTACDAQLMTTANIGAFACVARELSNPLPKHVSPLQVHDGRVGWLHLPLGDCASTILADSLEEAFTFIDEQNAQRRRVMLYCQAGKSRSVSVALAFIMREYGVDVKTAMQLLRRVHPEADPNLFFLEQLTRLHAVQSPVSRVGALDGPLAMNPAAVDVE